MQNWGGGLQNSAPKINNVLVKHGFEVNVNVKSRASEVPRSHGDSRERGAPAARVLGCPEAPCERSAF